MPARAVVAVEGLRRFPRYLLIGLLLTPLAATSGWVYARLLAMPMDVIAPLAPVYLALLLATLYWVQDDACRRGWHPGWAAVAALYSWPWGVVVYLLVSRAGERLRSSRLV